MEDFIIIVIGIFVVIMLAVIGLYNGMDRRRYRMDCIFRRCQPALNDWADACEELQSGSSEEYRKARRIHEKLACLQKMIENVTENSEEKLELQEMLLDFCYQLRQLAEPYNERLSGPIFGSVYKVLGFKYYTPIDFYPHIQVGRTSK